MIHKKMLLLKTIPVGMILLTLFLNGLFFATQLPAAQIRKTGTQRPYVINNRKYYPLPSSEGFVEQGIASWYGKDFHGRATSNGETYNMYDITAAHKLLPMHTMLLVQNLDNGRQTIVRVNDRGPFVQGRIIDLSYGSAKKVGLVNAGTARVKITALGEVSKKQNRGRYTFKKHVNLQTGEYFVQIGAFLKKNKLSNLTIKSARSNNSTC